MLRRYAVRRVLSDLVALLIESESKKAALGYFSAIPIPSTA